MWIIFFLIAALFIIPFGIYLYVFLRRMAGFFKFDIKRKAVKIGIIIITVIITLFCINRWGIVGLAFFQILVLEMCIDLINSIIKLITQNKNFCNCNSLWSKIYSSGFIPIAITIIVFCYGFWNMGNIVETNYTIHANKNIRAEGYRVAMIADLHYGTFLHKEILEKECNDITNANPDIVVLCGDIVEEATTIEEMKEAIELLGNIKSKYGVFYVYGNHDLSTYSSHPNFTEEQLNQALKDNDIHLLVDESYEINNDLVIIGRDDARFTLDSNRKSGQELLKNVDMNKFILLLDHQPVRLQENSDLGFDLQLSGHTHAGQIWPSGFISEISGLTQLNYGYKQIGDFQAIVSSGMAGWGFPIRTGSHSEYVIIEIAN